ncbi:MAG TPA: urease accessory protein UreE [Afifellaceae bacterium]|nr:urease accessory protein UreE [Afifellaceae bacterium]
MIRAVALKAAGSWAGEPADRVVLDFDARHRRRIAMEGVSGLSFLLDLPKAAALRQGDGLTLEDGRIVAVEAAAESLLEVRAADAHQLLRLAWHLGNRHLPAQIEPERILIRPDHVIAEMLRGLGASVAEVKEPFDPEGGAYASDGHSGHDYGHRHD